MNVKRMWYKIKEFISDKNPLFGCYNFAFVCRATVWLPIICFKSRFAVATKYILYSYETFESPYTYPSCCMA